MADVKWIKLSTDMFDNRKVKYIRKMPEGNDIMLIWVMLMTMAGKCNTGGKIFLTEKVNYDAISLADELGFKEETMTKALDILQDLDMITVIKGCYAIKNWEEYQNVEGMEKVKEQNRIRKQKQRAREKELTSLKRDSHVTVTQSHATDIDIDKEIDIERDKDIDNYSSLNTTAANISEMTAWIRENTCPPRLPQVIYFAQTHKIYEANRFWDKYSDRNWKDAKGNDIKDWQALMLAWARETGNIDEEAQV